MRLTLLIVALLSASAVAQDGTLQWRLSALNVRGLEIRCDGAFTSTSDCLEHATRVTFRGDTWDTVEVCYRDTCKSMGSLWAAERTQR